MRLRLFSAITVTILLAGILNACGITKNTPEETPTETQETEKHVLYGEGIGNLNAGKYKEAIDSFSAVIQIDPKYANAYANRGTAYGFLKMYTEALADYTKVIELEPDASDAYYNRGVAHSFAGNPENAIGDYTKVIELEPKNLLVYLNRGIEYKKNNRLEDAKDDFTKAIELTPNDPRSYFQRAQIYEGLKEEDKAIADYKESAGYGFKPAQDWLTAKKLTWEEKRPTLPPSEETSFDLKLEPSTQETTS